MSIVKECVWCGNPFLAQRNRRICSTRCYTARRRRQLKSDRLREEFDKEYAPRVTNERFVIPFDEEKYLKRSHASLSKLSKRPDAVVFHK